MGRTWKKKKKFLDWHRRGRGCVGLTSRGSFPSSQRREFAHRAGGSSKLGTHGSLVERCGSLAGPKSVRTRTHKKVSKGKFPSSLSLERGRNPRSGAASIDRSDQTALQGTAPQPNKSRLQADSERLYIARDGSERDEAAAGRHAHATARLSESLFPVGLLVSTPPRGETVHLADPARHEAQTSSLRLGGIRT